MIVREIVRGDATWRGADLGHAFYCIGLTADFRSRPFETIEAHCGLLKEVLSGSRFSSFVYLSSTRVYARGKLDRRSRCDPGRCRPTRTTSTISRS